MEHHAAHQLHIEVTHLEDAPGGLPADCEGLGQDVVQSLPIGQPLLKVGRPGLESLIAKRLNLWFQSIDLLDLGPQALELPIILGADEFLQQVVEHSGSNRVKPLSVSLYSHDSQSP